MNFFKRNLLYVFLLGAVVGPSSVQGQSAVTAAAGDSARSSDEDEIWTNTIWTEIDEMVKEENYERQAIVTVAGARGAEAKNPVLDKLYYRGARRYPSQEKLHGAIEKLRQSIVANPKGSGVAEKMYYIGQCREKLGQNADARTQYSAIKEQFPESRWAVKAQRRLAKLN